MRKIKLRYWILLSDIGVTSLFYIFLRIYFSADNQTEKDAELIDVIGTILNAYVYIAQYLWINIIWLGLILFGLIKKNKELIIGGLMSLLLSTGLIFILFNL